MKNQIKLGATPAIKTNYKESWLFFSNYYKKNKKGTIAIIIISFLISSTTIVLPFLTKLLKSNPDSASDLSSLIFFSFLISIIALLKIILNYFLSYIGGIFDIKMETTIRKDMIENLNSLSMEQFDNSPIGIYFSRIQNDIKQINSNASKLLNNFVTIFSLIIGGFSFIFYVDWVAGIVTLVIYMIMLIIFVVFKNKLVYHQQINKTLNTFMTVGIGERVQMISEIKSYNNSKSTIKQFDKLQDDYFQSTKRYIKKTSLFKLVGISASIFVSTAILIIGTFLVDNKAIESDELIGLILASSILIIPIEKTAITTTDIITLNATIVRINEFYSWKFEVNDGDKKIPFNGMVEFKDVCFSYKIRGRTFEVFKNLSFKIENNKSTLIRGKSASGKTTILKLLMRYYEIDSGEILIDGINIKDYDINFLRSNISYQAHDPKLFSSSLELEDLHPNKKRLNEIAKVLEIEELMKRRIDIDQNINSQGLQVSDSEKQMLSILRAIYFDTYIILFDFPEYSIDESQIKAVKRALDIFAKNKTIIFTAYEFESSLEFDNFIKL